MPSRPTARCTRAVQQQLRAPLEAIWITDGLLSSAFERYCHVSHLARRNSSSTPGPLESRRRLGKRKMTAMHLDHQSTLPPWSIEFPVDLSKWKWQPPTLRSSRGKKDLHVEEDRPAPAASTTPWSAIQKMMGALAAEENDGEDVRGETVSADPLSERLSQARSAVAVSTPQAMDPAFESFTGDLKQDIESGALDADAVVMAVSTFPQSLANVEADKQVVSTAVREFLSAVVSGITSSSRFSAADFKDAFWNQVLLQVSELPGGHTNLSLFQTILDAIPAAHIDDVHEGVVAAVQSLVATREMWRTRAADIGVALGRLCFEDHTALLRKLETAIHEGLGETQDQTHQLLWLQILAHMPLVRQEHLLDACVRSAYFDRSLVGPVGRDLSELLFHQWTSRGHLRHHWPTVAEWQSLCDGRPELSLAALAVKIGAEGPFRRCVPTLISYLKFLRRFGRQEDLIDSMRAFCQVHDCIPVRACARLAKAVGDHRFALTTLSVLEEHADRLDGKKRQWWQLEPISERDKSISNKWDWTHWAPYVEDMIKDESINPAVVWKVVRSGAVADVRETNDPRAVETWMSRGQKWPQRRATAEHLKKRRIRLISDMAVWFSQAGHLTDSVVLRNVGRCVRWLKAHQAELGRSVVLAVVSVGLRELKRCEPGRTKRISWALDIIEAHGGEKERRMVAHKLQRWRETNVVLSEREEQAKSG